MDSHNTWIRFWGAGQEVRPLSQTDPEAVTSVTRWLDSHAKPAGLSPTATVLLNGQRKRRVTTGLTPFRSPLEATAGP